MENQTNYYDKIEIWISTQLSTFEPEFRKFLSTPRLSQKKGVLIKKSVYMLFFFFRFDSGQSVSLPVSQFIHKGDMNECNLF